MIKQNLAAYLSVLIFLLFVVQVTPISAQTILPTPDDLLPAAEAILKEKFCSSPQYYIELLPYFNSADILTDFRLGKPFPLYILQMDKVWRLKDNSGFSDALEFRGWQIPIYVGSVETEPRTYFSIKQYEDGEWRYGSMGGDPNPMCRARGEWPIVDGYNHAKIRFSTTNIFLIMIENENGLQFWYDEDADEGGDRIFKLSRNEDGSWPAFSRDYFIDLIKRGMFAVRERHMPRHPSDPYLPCYIGIEEEHTKYEAIDKGQLHRNPRILHYEKPSYPELARAAGIEGTAVLEVLIGRDGKVENAKITQSEITPSMEKSILDAAKTFVYQPGIRENQPVRCKGTHLIKFVLNDDAIMIRME